MCKSYQRRNDLCHQVATCTSCQHRINCTKTVMCNTVYNYNIVVRLISLVRSDEAWLQCNSVIRMCQMPSVSALACDRLVCYQLLCIACSVCKSYVCKFPAFIVC